MKLKAPEQNSDTAITLKTWEWKDSEDQYKRKARKNMSRRVREVILTLSSALMIQPAVLHPALGPPRM